VFIPPAAQYVFSLNPLLIMILGFVWQSTVCQTDQYKIYTDGEKASAIDLNLNEALYGAACRVLLKASGTPPALCLNAGSSFIFC